MKKYAFLGIFGRNVTTAAILLMGTTLPAITQQQFTLGRVSTGAEILFTRSASGDWGVEVVGGLVPRIAQPKPAAIEVYRTNDDIRELSTGYKTLDEGQRVEFDVAPGRKGEEAQNVRVI